MDMRSLGKGQDGEQDEGGRMDGSEDERLGQRRGKEDWRREKDQGGGGKNDTALLGSSKTFFVKSDRQADGQVMFLALPSRLPLW